MLLTEGDYETNHRVLSVLGHIAKNIDKPTLLQLAGETRYLLAQHAIALGFPTAILLIFVIH